MAKTKEISIDELVGKENTEIIPPQKGTYTVKTSNKKTIIVSVVSTLAVLAAIVAIFYGGMKYEQGRQDVIVKQAVELSSKMLKPEQ